MTVKDIDMYLKLKARADHPTTPAPEAANAQKQLMAMELEHPDIAAKALHVQTVLNGTDEFFPRVGASAPGTPAAPKNAVLAFVDGMVRGAASEFADRVAGEVSGAGRHEALRSGQVVTRRMSCGKGQVCIEIRANQRDMQRRQLRDQVMDRVEELLRE